MNNSKTAAPTYLVGRPLVSLVGRREEEEEGKEMSSNDLSHLPSSILLPLLFNSLVIGAHVGGGCRPFVMCCCEMSTLSLILPRVGSILLRFFAASASLPRSLFLPLLLQQTSSHLPLIPFKQ